MISVYHKVVQDNIDLHILKADNEIADEPRFSVSISQICRNIILARFFKHQKLLGELIK